MLNKEPILNIGIILPADKRRDIKLSFSNKNNYTIKSQNINPSISSENLIVSLKDGEVEIIEKNLKSYIANKIAKKIINNFIQ